MTATNHAGKDAAPEPEETARPRLTKKVIAIIAAVFAAGGLAAGLTLGLEGSSLPPESTNPQRDIVGTWTCTWPGYSAHVTFAQDDSVRYSSSGTSAPGFSQQINGSSTGTVFIGAKEIIATWELNNPAYTVHVRGQQMTLGNPANGETCVRQ